MKYHLCILLIFLTALVGVAAAADSSTEAASGISATEIRVNPNVLMKGDTGTVVVKIANSGSQAVAISRARLYSGDIDVINHATYDAVGTINPGASMEFTFTVKADADDGMYYPMFYLDLRDGECLRTYVPVRIESTNVVVSVADAPDTFPAAGKDTITLSVGNPRDNTVNGVTVTPVGEGFKTTQTAAFLGALSPDDEKNASFEITVTRSTEITFDISYRNGINEHHTFLTVPAEVGDRVVHPEPVVNNIEVQQSGTGYTLTGDVTNAGLKDAYSVQVTVGSPAKSTDPYPVYVVGALEPDDFSSFEVTCTAQGASSIPLIIKYKDEDGNTFEETVTVSLSRAGQAMQGSSGNTNAQAVPGGSGRSPQGGMFGMSGAGFSQMPILEIVLVIIGGVVLVVAWRKGYIGKIRDRIRDRSRK